MLFALPFPAIDPVLISFGPFVIHWYALAYIGGLLLGWRYMRALAAKAPTVGKPEDIDDFLVWATLGVVLGGRLGYILFYRPGYYLANPLEILAVWQGGMSFHGGILGVTVAGILFVRRRGIAIRRSPTGWRARRRSACCSAASPISSTASCGSRGGRFLGGGLSRARPVPRHPSQLYEAALEGALLFAILTSFSGGTACGPARRADRRFCRRLRAGAHDGRNVPRARRHIGFLPFGTTWGQWLSLPMLAIGLVLIVSAVRKGTPA